MENECYSWGVCSKEGREWYLAAGGVWMGTPHQALLVATGLNDRKHRNHTDWEAKEWKESVDPPLKMAKMEKYSPAFSYLYWFNERVCVAYTKVENDKYMFGMAFRKEHDTPNLRLARKIARGRANSKKRAMCSDFEPTVEFVAENLRNTVTFSCTDSSWKRTRDHIGKTRRIPWWAVLEFCAAQEELFLAAQEQPAEQVKETQRC